MKKGAVFSILWYPHCSYQIRASPAEVLFSKGKSTLQQFSFPPEVLFEAFSRTIFEKAHIPLRFGVPSWQG